MAEIDLKPCPFCGGPATVQEYGCQHKGDGLFEASYNVGCKKCNIYFKYGSKFRLELGYPKFEVNGLEKAVSMWNMRPSSENS